MNDPKCKERYDFLSSREDILNRNNPGFDGSNEAWFSAGWNAKSSSLTGTRVRLRDLFKLLPKDGSIPFKVFDDLSKAIVALGGEPLDFSELLPVYLERYKPIRIVMREGEDGKLKGLTELSFAMDIDDKRVNIFWSGKAFSILGEHDLNGIEWAKNNARPGDFVFDPLDPLCPAQVDWATWLSATDKYGKRNAPFVLRQFEPEEEDAALK